MPGGETERNEEYRDHLPAGSADALSTYLPHQKGLAKAKCRSVWWAVSQSYSRRASLRLGTGADEGSKPEGLAVTLMVC